MEELKGLKKFLKKLIKLIKRIWIYKKLILIALLVAGLFSILGAFKFQADASTVAGTGDIARAKLGDSVSMSEDNGKWEIPDDAYADIKKDLKKRGIDVQGLEKKGVLEKIIKAELVTHYPNLGQDVEQDDLNSFQGIVNFIRRDAEGTSDGILMKYMEAEEFHRYVEANDYDAIEFFYTIDFGINDMTNSNNQGSQENEENEDDEETKKSIIKDIKITVAKKSEENGVVSVSTQNIDYQKQIVNYGVPIEFIIANLQITNNPNYAIAIADLVIKNSKIDYLIQDTYYESITNKIYSYYEKPMKVVRGNIRIEDKSRDGFPNSIIQSTNITKVWSIVPYIKEADIWAANITNNYKKTEEGPTTTAENINILPDEEGDTFTRTNRKTLDEITIKSITYSPIISSNSGGTATENDGYDAIFENTKTGNKYREYRQNKGSYMNDTYWVDNNPNDQDTIAYAGCGPSSIAIVASGYGLNYDPGDVGNDMGGANAITSYITLKAELEKLGFGAKVVHYNGTSAKNEAKEWLKTGKVSLVSVGVKGSLNDQRFANVSHIMALLDYKEDTNEVYVANPNVYKTDGHGWIDFDTVCGYIDGYFILVDDSGMQGNSNQGNSNQGNNNQGNNNQGNNTINSLENILFIGDSWLTIPAIQSKFPASCTFKAVVGKTAQYWNSQTTSGVSDVSAITIMLGLNNPNDVSSMKKLIDKLERRIS